MTFKLPEDHDIEEDITFPGNAGFKVREGDPAPKKTAGYSFNSGAQQGSASSPGYTINEAKHTGKAGFRISSDDREKPKSFMRKHWLKALLMLPLAYYVAEGVYYTSQTDHPDEYAMAGVPGYVIEEIGYDLEDAFHFASGLISEPKEGPQIPPGSNYVPQWMVQEELKVLFLQPRHVDDNFNEIAPAFNINRFYEAQQQYVLDAISDGKGTKMGNAAAHDEYMTISLVSPSEVTSRMSPGERSEFAQLSPDEQLKALMKPAGSMLDRTQSRDHTEQRNTQRSGNSAIYKPAY